MSLLDKLNKEVKIMYKVGDTSKSLRSLGLNIKQEELITFPMLQEELVEQEVGSRNGNYYRIRRYLDRSMTLTCYIEDLENRYAKIDQIYNTLGQENVVIYFEGDTRGLLVKRFNLEYNRGKRADEIIINFVFEPFTINLKKQWVSGSTNTNILSIKNDGFVETDYLTLEITTKNKNATIEFNGVLIPLNNNVAIDTITIDCRTMEIKSKNNDVLCICMYPTLEVGANNFRFNGISGVKYSYMKLYR